MAASGSGAVAWLALLVGAAGVGLALLGGNAPSKDREAESEADLLDARSMENRVHDAEVRLERAEERVRQVEDRLAKAERTAEEAASTARSTRKVLEEKGGLPLVGDGAAPPADPDAEARKAEAEALLAAVREGRLPEGGAFQLFQRGKELGILDQALAEMEKFAAAHSAEPDAQVELAAAYIAKLMAVPEGMERGAWAMKSLAACDAALKAQPDHWAAQFMKGMNLSQWPAFLGRQPDAVKTFEKLIEQQERSAPDPKFAQTYFQLGTTYRGAGNVEKAREVFRRGLEIFPDNRQLKEQMELLEKR